MPTLNAALEAMLPDLDGRMGQQAAQSHAIGRAWGLIVREKLAEASGWKSAWAFWSERYGDDLKQDTLHCWARVAEAFTEEEVIEFRPSRLDLLRRWSQLAGSPPSRPLGEMRVRVPADGDAVNELPFTQCGVSQLRAAIALLSDRAGHPVAAIRALTKEEKERIADIRDTASHHWGVYLDAPVLGFPFVGKELAIDVGAVPLKELRKLIEFLELIEP